MSTIEVTSPLAAPNATLALHTCASCGRHVWERDGVELQGETILDAVKERVAERPARKVPAPRKPRPPQVADPVQERLKGFRVHGT